MKRAFVHLKRHHRTRYKKQIKFVRQQAVRHVFNTVLFTLQDGRTPLHQAVECGHTAVVRKLLDSSADLGIKENLVRNLFTEIYANC